jgi:predicted nucleic acid-binding protein
MRRWYIEAERIACSIIGLIETRRAVARQVDRQDRVEAIFRSVATLDVDDVVARVAASLPPVTLRTVDAIHLASALGLVGELDAFVTYDDRLADAARAVGLPVIRPA